MQQEYNAGDLIFAKVRGYPAWPARVSHFMYLWHWTVVAGSPTQTEYCELLLLLSCIQHDVQHNACMQQAKWHWSIRCNIT